MMEPMADEVDKYIDELDKECLKGKPIKIKDLLDGNYCVGGQNNLK